MKNIVLEIKILIYDILFFIHPKRKALLSNISGLIKLNTIRILIYRLPGLIFRKKNKDCYKLNINKYESGKFSDSKECFQGKCNIPENFLNYVIELSDKYNTTLGGAIPSNRGGIEKIKIDSIKYKAKYTLLPANITKDIMKRIMSKDEIEQFLYAGSILSGYKVKLSDITISIGITKGENSNSYWHSDAFYPIIKGFIYLVDISIKDAPFEFAEKTTDINFISKIYNDNSLHKKINSPRITTNTQLKKIKAMNIISHTGKAGSFMLCNTSGMHRKGEDISGKERILLAMEFKRLNLFKRLVRSFQKIN